MNRRLLFILIAIGYAALLYECAPKASKSKTTETYQEDLSKYRPKPVELEIDSADIGAVDTAFVRGPYTAPTNDITEELDYEIARISDEQKKLPILIYTVQVYTGRSREEANQIRSQVYQTLPDEEPQLIYQQPNFKVRVGTYFERADAYKTFKALKEKFAGAILVPVRIIPEDSESEY
jgi:hypothetical protein